LCDLFDLEALQIAFLDHPRRTFAQLLRRQALLVDKTANRRWADIQGSGGFVQGDFSPLSTLALSVGRDGVLVAQAANTDTGPAIAAGRRLASPVEDCGSGIVKRLARLDANEIDDICSCAPAVLAFAILPDLHRGVIAALPVDHQIEHLVADVHDYFMDQGSDDAFARRGRCTIRSIRGVARPCSLSGNIPTVELSWSLFRSATDRSPASCLDDARIGSAA
jgi:hypothetical protein